MPRGRGYGRRRRIRVRVMRPRRRSVRRAVRAMKRGVGLRRIGRRL